MKLPILEAPPSSNKTRSTRRSPVLEWSQSLLERAVAALPADARILVAPGGINAQLAVTDLLKKTYGDRGLLSGMPMTFPIHITPNVDRLTRRWH
jgi:hypothetical protein